MLSHTVRTIAALSLMLSATASVAGSLPEARGHKCTKSHNHAKRAAPKPAPRGAGLVEQRRSPDVQILSFGP